MLRRRWLGRRGAHRHVWIKSGHRGRHPSLARALKVRHAAANSPCPKMIARPSLIELLFVITPHSLLLDIAGPAEAFRLANLHRAARKLAPRFRLRFAGPVAKAQSSVGLA